MARGTRALAPIARVPATSDTQGRVESETAAAATLERSESDSGLVNFASRRSRSKTGPSSRLRFAPERIKTQPAAQISSSRTAHFANSVSSCDDGRQTVPTGGAGCRGGSHSMSGPVRHSDVADVSPVGTMTSCVGTAAARKVMADRSTAATKFFFTF
jgi:hypothetical protein